MSKFQKGWDDFEVVIRVASEELAKKSVGLSGTQLTGDAFIKCIEYATLARMARDEGYGLIIDSLAGLTIKVVDDVIETTKIKKKMDKILEPLLTKKIQ